jgi:hypothetical protein
MYDSAQPVFVKIGEAPESACDFLQHCTWSVDVVLLAKLEHIRPQDQIAFMWRPERVSWIDAAGPCDRLNVMRVRNPDAIDASPVAEQFNGLTLDHPFLPAGLLLPYRRGLALLRRCHVSTRVHGLGGRRRRSYCSPLSTHFVLDDAFQGLPQQRDVGGVWFELQRSKDATSDGGDIGVAGPSSDGESVWHLDKMPIHVAARACSVFITASPAS